MADLPENAVGSNRNPHASKRPRVLSWFIVNLILFALLMLIQFSPNLQNYKLSSDAFSIVSGLATGGLVSFLLYFLVVHTPHQTRLNNIKSHLTQVYIDLKTDLLWSIVNSSMKGGRHDLVPSSDFVERLLDPSEFRRTFRGGRESTEGFYAFQNQMCDNTLEYQQILQTLTMLSKQIEFILYEYDLNLDALTFFKRLELIIIRLRANGPGYDESKPLCNFIWEICAGWSVVVGDLGGDPIQKIIGQM